MNKLFKLLIACFGIAFSINSMNSSEGFKQLLPLIMETIKSELAPTDKVLTAILNHDLESLKQEIKTQKAIIDREHELTLSYEKLSSLDMIKQNPAREEINGQVYGLHSVFYSHTYLSIAIMFSYLDKTTQEKQASLSVIETLLKNGARPNAHLIEGFLAIEPVRRHEIKNKAELKPNEPTCTRDYLSDLTVIEYTGFDGCDQKIVKLINRYSK